MLNVLESYLVSLGFQSDKPSFDKLQTMMADAERSVTTHTSGMVKRVLEAQGAIVGAFTAICVRHGLNSQTQLDLSQISPVY